MQYLLNEEEYKEYKKLLRESGKEKREDSKEAAEKAKTEEEQEKENVAILIDFVRKAEVIATVRPEAFGQRRIALYMNEEDMNMKFLAILERRLEEAL